MAVRPPAAAIGRALAGPPGQVLRWARAHKPLTAVVLSIALGVLTALGPLTILGPLMARHGSAGTLIYLAIAMPQGWAVAVMVYTLLTPDLVGASGRRSMISRWLLWSTLPVLLVQQLTFLHFAHRMDTLEISGWLVLLTGLELARRTPAKLRLTIQRLRDREVLVPAAHTAGLSDRVAGAGHGWSAASGWLVAAALLITSPWTLIAASSSSVAALGLEFSDLVLLIVAGAVAGSWLGRMASCARLLGKASLDKHRLQLRMIPDHPDGAGGLKPIGDFHLYQSLSASLPAIFLAAWVLLISLAGKNQLWSVYRPYLNQYLWLLLPAILFEVLVFVVPMNSVHTIMKSQKEDVFLAAADNLFTVTASAQASPPGNTEAEQDAARQLLIKRFQELDNAPTWPINSSIRRRFTVRNIAFLIPFLGYVVGHMSFWQNVSEYLKG